jgi:transcriptional regulator with XRE-family HTH domain
MKTIVQHLREERSLTQTELAEKSGLSLRTIQRIEAGNQPKGYTLRALAHALETAPQKLIHVKETTNVDNAKWINFSSLSGMIIPFGGVIFPLILTYRTQDPTNKQLGKSILSVQIILAVTLAITQIASPFIQKAFSLDFPLFIIPLLFIFGLKLAVVIANGISLNTKNDLHKNLKINYL